MSLYITENHANLLRNFDIRKEVPFGVSAKVNSEGIRPVVAACVILNHDRLVQYICLSPAAVSARDQ